MLPRVLPEHQIQPSTHYLHIPLYLRSGDLIRKLVFNLLERNIFHQLSKRRDFMNLPSLERSCVIHLFNVRDRRIGRCGDACRDDDAFVDFQKGFGLGGGCQVRFFF